MTDVKLLWLCNMVPGLVQEKMDGKAGSGLWIDHVLTDMVRQENLTMRILCRGERTCSGSVNEHVSYGVFEEAIPHVYLPELEARFCRELEEFRPDAIHIWGTEYGHTLAMMNAAVKTGMEKKAAISIQGLCSVYAGHYAEGVPYSIQKKSTFRDFIRKDNILQQQKKYVLRGELEIRALEKAAHVIGRTDWDHACTAMLSQGSEYHLCNETLREPFYQDQWSYDNCQKHRIFASSCVYPVKGFHYLLEAFAKVLKDYPDATLAVPGKSFLVTGLKEKMRQQEYHKYLAELAEGYGVADKIEFLGGLSAQGMKDAFLNANVFVLPSTIENSPNSLGEAMLLGVPCVSGDVGGVTTMMEHNKEGFVYQSTAAYMLAYYIEKVFQMGSEAESMGQAAREHARKTHDPQKNLRDLLAVYAALAEEA